MAELPRLLRIIRHEPEPGQPDSDAAGQAGDTGPGAVAAPARDPGPSAADGGQVQRTDSGPRPPAAGSSASDDEETARGLQAIRLTGRPMTGWERSAVQGRHWAAQARELASDCRGVVGGLLGPVLDHIGYVRSRSWVPPGLRGEPAGSVLSALGAVIGWVLGTPLVAVGSVLAGIGRRNGRIVIALVLVTASWLAFRYGR